MGFGRSSSKELTKDFDFFQHVFVENQKLFLPEYLVFPNLNIPKFSNFFDNFWLGKIFFENFEIFRVEFFPFENIFWKIIFLENIF